MDLEAMDLEALAAQLRLTPGLRQKADIQTAARHLGNGAVAVGDDCAAIADGDGYLLLAAEGLWPQLVDSEPWFAGWCAVLVNVSDVYAMGGRPLAVVDALWSCGSEAAEPLWAGMVAASKTFNVPIVGGHSNGHSPYNALAVAILGRAQRLLTSFSAQVGDTLVLVADFAGRSHPRYPFWDAATMKSPADLQAQLALLPQLAETGLCDTAKDISMGGLIGTTLMLMETSGCGAQLNLDVLPHPAELTLAQWLISFPSYGFLLSLRPPQLPAVQALFQGAGLECAPIGTVVAEPTLTLTAAGQSATLWNLQTTALTGFSGHG